MKANTLAIALLAAALPFPSRAEPEPQVAAVRAYLSQSLALGGYFENSFTSIWGPDTSSQTVTDSHRLGINLGAELSERFRFVSQFSLGFSFPLENEHGNAAHGALTLPLSRTYGALAFGALLSQSYGEYAASDSFRVRFGLGYAPYGHAFQVREPVLFLKKKGPQLIRTSGAHRVIIADPFWKGVHFSGDLGAGLAFDLYTTSALDHSGKLGGGARLSYSSDDRLTAGVSAQSAGQAGGTYASGGADLRLDFRGFGLLAEAGLNRTPGGTPWSFYVQPFVRLLDERLTFFLSFDYLNNPIGETLAGSTTVADPFVKWEHTVGAAYQFIPGVRARLDFTIHDYLGATATVLSRNRDYSSVTLSSGVSF